MKIKFLIGLIALSIISCSSPSKEIKKAETFNYKINKTADKNIKDTGLRDSILKYKKGLGKQMQEVIAHSDIAITKGKPESLMGNYLADALLKIANNFCTENKLNYNIDIAILNTGGIRTSLPSGDILVENMFNVLPFPNKIGFVKLRGKYIKNLCNQLAKKGGQAISNMQMGIKDSKASKILIAGKPLEFEKYYYIVSVDYLINGGDNMVAFSKNDLYFDTSLKLRDAIIKHMRKEYKKGIKIQVKLDGRTYNEQ